MTLPCGGSFDPSPLYHLAAELSGACLPDVVAVGAILLRPPPGDASGLLRSTLNNDGTPLQICLTASQDGVTVKLIGDPGATAISVPQRLAAGQAAIDTLFGRTKPHHAGADLLAATLPPSLTDYPQAKDGIVWLGRAIGDPARALYVKARWSDAGTDWDRIAAVVQRMLARPQDALAAVEAIRAVARPVSIGLETAEAGQARLKLYWRLTHPVLLRSLGIAVLGDASFGDFLHRIVGAGRVPATGLVFSISHALASGTISDAKLDICAHCVPQTPAQWADAIQDLAAGHRVAMPEIGAALRTRRAEVAFIGYGLDMRGQKRLNVYLKGVSSNITQRSVH